MTLPVSPNSISMAQVNTELGRASNYANSNLNESVIRTLFGKPSGAISMSDGHGKSSRTYVHTGTMVPQKMANKSGGYDHGYIQHLSLGTYTQESGATLTQCYQREAEENDSFNIVFSSEIGQQTLYAEFYEPHGPNGWMSIGGLERVGVGVYFNPLYVWAFWPGESTPIRVWY